MAIVLNKKIYPDGPRDFAQALADALAAKDIEACARMLVDSESVGMLSLLSKEKWSAGSADVDRLADLIVEACLEASRSKSVSPFGFIPASWKTDKGGKWATIVCAAFGISVHLQANGSVLYDHKQLRGSRLGSSNVWRVLYPISKHSQVEAKTEDDAGDEVAPRLKTQEEALPDVIQKSVGKIVKVVKLHSKLDQSRPAYWRDLYVGCEALVVDSKVKVDISKINASLGRIINPSGIWIPNLLVTHKGFNPGVKSLVSNDDLDVEVVPSRILDGGWGSDVQVFKQSLVELNKMLSSKMDFEELGLALALRFTGPMVGPLQARTSRKPLGEALLAFDRKRTNVAYIVLDARTAVDKGIGLGLGMKAGKIDLFDKRQIGSVDKFSKMRLRYAYEEIKDVAELKDAPDVAALCTGVVERELMRRARVADLSSEIYNLYPSRLVQDQLSAIKEGPATADEVEVAIFRIIKLTVTSEQEA